MIEQKNTFKAILVGVDRTTIKANDNMEPGWGISESLSELEELCSAAGMEVCGRVVQRKGTVDSKHYLGIGKLNEAKDIAIGLDANVLVFDDEISPSQIRNIEASTELAVLDRTQIILDIFSQRARSSEGKLQVELAQLTYLLPRLRSSDSNFSRLGAGIGTRGPGETKLETDLRKIRDRISDIKQKLKEVELHRGLLRKNHRNNSTPIGAIVGYTNAGKSTLLQTLTGVDIFVQDMLFATLDPLLRNVVLPNGRTVLLSDTVGFIRKLPHHLVAAFKSSLEEVVWADFLIHVVDASNPNFEGQIAAVDKVLGDLDAVNKPTILVMNKVDLCDKDPIIGYNSPHAEHVCLVSLLTNAGVETLSNSIVDMVFKNNQEIGFLFPYSELGDVQLLRKNASIITEEFCDEGLKVKCIADDVTIGMLSKYTTT